MKVSREVAAGHRQRILKEASKLFRAHGVDGISVAEITKAAGLTHGGFYGHFASKEALLGEAGALALTEQAERAAANGLETSKKCYLSHGHVLNAAQGCAIAALGGEIARQDVSVKARFLAALNTYVDAFNEQADAAGRQRAINTVAHLVGAILMARLASGVDEPLVDEILEAAGACDTSALPTTRKPGHAP